MENVKFTREEVAEFSKVAAEAQKILYNHASSFITIELRELVSKLSKKLGLNLCMTCPSGIAVGLGNVFGQYAHDKAVYAAEDENKKAKQANNQQCTKEKRKTKK